MSDTYIAELGYRVDTRPLKQGETALDNLTKAGEKTEAGIGRISSSVGILSAGIAALAANTVINDVINYSDAWTMVDNKLRLVINSEDQLIQKRTDLIALSKETNANLDSTVALYAELYRNTRALGTAEEDVMTVTRTLNNLFVSGGKDAQTQAGAIRQLSQALGAGALRGDEFNSVSEAAPRILDALSTQLNITKGELRDFAATGGITAEILVDAVGQYSTEAQRLADATGTTFEQNMQNVNTNVTAYIGASKSITDATAALGETFEDLSENIDSIVRGAGIASTVMLAYASVTGGKVLAAEVARIASTVSLTKAEAIKTAGTLASARSDVAMLAANKQALASTIARTQSENIRNTVRTQLTKTTIALSVAETRLAAAETAAATAGARATTSAIALAGATTALGTAVRFLMGPWGLLITAVGLGASAFMSSKSASEEAAEALENQREKVDKLAQSYLNMSKAQLGSASIGAREELLSLQLEKQDAEERLKQAMSNVSNFGGGAATSIPIMKEISEIDGKIKDITTSLDAMNKAFESSLPDEWKGLDDDDKPDSLSKKFKSQMDSLKQLRKEVGLSSDDLFVFRQEQRSIANGDTPAMTAAIVAQANEIVEARNKIERDKVDLKDLFGTDTVDTFALQQSKDYDAWIESISTTTTEIQRLQEEIAKVEQAMEMGDLDKDIGREYIDSLNTQLKGLDTSPFDSITNSTKDGLASIQGLSEQGSKEYKKLGIAIQAVNAIQAVGAVLNQANGDPYTAFGRMAAMAASVASLGFSVGGLSGGFTDDSVENQANQGLNVWGDKSESIANGIDLIASATESLVGINTNMLKALTSVQDGIAAAAAIVGRDIDTPQISVNVKDNLFDGLQNFFSGDVLNLTGLLGDTFVELLNMPLNFLGSWLGGSSSVTDEGIRILGGSLGDMMDDITVESFQAVKYKKWKFGSTKYKTQYQDITSEVGSQFQLILDSIADSVFAGASMLGFSDSQLSEAIQNFEIATIDISLKDLSAEEQQAEIEAVFSSIFDDLAGSVIPFLDEFQMVGEGLGETLARVATQVNIMDLMVEQLGVTMFDKFSDPRLYAEAAASISDLVGGVEDLAEKTSSFIDSFAPEATKIDIYSKSLEDSLSAVGLKLPETAEGFWELMQGLDASTAAGQEQIATLLNSQDIAKEYYDLISKNDLAQGYRDAIEGMYDVTEEVAKANLNQALSAARSGDFSLAEGLDLSSVGPSMSNYSSRLEYELARADSAAKLEELAKLTEGTISVDEKQLETLEQIRDSLENNPLSGQGSDIANLNSEVGKLNATQYKQSRVIADSNALLQQMVSDGIPVRIEA